MLLKTTIDRQYININSALAFKTFADTAYLFIRRAVAKGHRPIVFICIGTDRSTGDSLGPLIGYKMGSLKYRNVFVLGNLENPVHAKNLDSVLSQVYDQYDRPYVVAIDACLGKMEHVGCVTIGEGPIKPGSGVNKDLVAVGDMHITGIVNFGGFMDFLVLQNTRLNVVMKMADLVSMGIRYVMWKIGNDPEVSYLFSN